MGRESPESAVEKPKNASFRNFLSNCRKKEKRCEKLHMYVCETFGI